jgi:hypothetical protein
MTCNPSCQCCKGACCCGASCTQETCQDCEDGHGVWSGPGTQCANQECDQPTGACCGESCAILSECECLQGGGEYQGDDTTCSPDPCGETVCSGPCDEENPCPEGCACVDGQCAPPPDCPGPIVGIYSGCNCWHAPENEGPGEDAAIACAQSACDQFWTPEYSQYACPEGYVIADCIPGEPQVDPVCGPLEEGGPPFYIVHVSVSCCPEENPLP